MTPHFTLDELTHTDHRELDNTPNESEIANIQRLAEFLEQVKEVLGASPSWLTQLSDQRLSMTLWAVKILLSIASAVLLTFVYPL